MQTYYFTFGQNHPLRDNWIEIMADDCGAARNRIVESFGNYILNSLKP